jgi:predicted nucleic acid-binding protein
MYIDTSLLVPYYCPEPLSRAAERTIRGDPRAAVSDLVEVEFFSALARKTRERDMSTADATRAGERFVDHLQAGLYARLPVQRQHYEAARTWLARFTLPLRTLDALHLALADLEGLRLATADEDLSRSAKRLGIAVTLLRA